MINDTRQHATSTHLVLIVAFVACSPNVMAGQCCPRCEAGCSLSVDKVDHSKHCWKIETEQVCIPRVVFPWQRARLECPTQGCSDFCTASENKPANNGAFVLTVRKLKKHTYKCPKCEYTWSVGSATGCTDATIPEAPQAGEQKESQETQREEPQEEAAPDEAAAPHFTEFSIDDCEDVTIPRL